MSQDIEPPQGRQHIVASVDGTPIAYQTMGTGPGLIVVGGSLRTSEEPYRERLIADDPFGAFVHFIRGSGGAPAVVAKLPHWYLRAVLRIGFRGPGWRRMRPLLAACLAEHEQIAARQGRLAEFAAVTASVLILCGSRSTESSKAEFVALRDTIPNATLATLDGLDHFGPDGKSGTAVAERTLAFLS